MSKSFRFSPGCGCCCGCRNYDTAILVNRDLTMGDTNSQAPLTAILGLLENNFQSSSCKWLGAATKWGVPEPEYSDGVEIVHTFDTSLTAVLAAIFGVPHDGYNTFNHGYLAIQYIIDNWVLEGGRSNPADNPRLLFWLSDTPSGSGGSIPTTADLVAAAVAADIRIVPVSTGSPGMNYFMEAQGHDLAAGTGGRYFDLTGSYNSNVLLEDLCELYA